MLSLIRVPYKLLIVHLVGRYNEFAMISLWGRGREGQTRFPFVTKSLGRVFCFAISHSLECTRFSTLLLVTIDRYLPPKGKGEPLAHRDGLLCWYLHARLILGRLLVLICFYCQGGSVLCGRVLQFLVQHVRQSYDNGKV